MKNHSFRIHFSQHYSKHSRSTFGKFFNVMLHMTVSVKTIRMNVCDYASVKRERKHKNNDCSLKHIGLLYLYRIYYEKQNIG